MTRAFYLCRILAFAYILTFGFCAIANAQSDSLHSGKTFDNFVSLQANELLRQIISFDQRPDINNPYLFKYTLRHNKTGLTFNAGIGFSIDKVVDEKSVETRSDMNNFRFGFGYQKHLGKVIEAGAGVDFIMGNDRLETVAISVQDFQTFRDSSYATSKEISSSVGFGLQGSLTFVVAKWVTVGTEFSIQYIKSEESFNSINKRYVVATDPFVQESASITAVNEKDDRTRTQILLPVAIFIGIRF